MLPFRGSRSDEHLKSYRVVFPLASIAAVRSGTANVGTNVGVKP